MSFLYGKIYGETACENSAAIIFHIDEHFLLSSNIQNCCGLFYQETSTNDSYFDSNDDLIAAKLYLS